MKRILLSGLLTCGLLSAFSQNAFYDAQYLVTLPTKSIDKMQDAAVHSHIDLSDAETAALADYKSFLADPFAGTLTHLDINLLKSSISKYNAYEAQNNLGANAFVGGLAALSLIPNILGGGFSLSAEQQTNIIDGLTKYYAEEFKKAQLVTYMKAFESTIDKVPELQVLFPSTYKKLKNADPSKFPDLGSEYKSIFDEDLKTIIDHLVDHVEHYKAPVKGNDPMLLLTEANDSIIKNNQYYGCFKITADMASKLMNNYHPSDLFHYLDDTYYTPSALAASNKTEKFECIIHALNILQRNFLDTGRSKSTQFSNIWVNSEELKNLNTVEEWKYFAGLIYQQDPAFFKAMLWDPTTHIFDAAHAAARIRRIHVIMDPVIASLRELQSLGSELNKDNLKDNFVSFTNLVLKSLQTANYLNEDIKDYLALAGYTLNIYDNARKKDYSNTVYYTLLIIEQLCGKKEDKLFTALDQYGGFMADVINAKSSDEVKEMIKKNVAPPTTFMLKRTYRSTFSITGQPGYFISVEKLNDKTGFVSGITLPLGFEYTLKSKFGKENASSWGLMLQLLDLGAILNFRVGDETSTLPDKVEFSQVFSPGGAISYGFKNSPLTIGVGYQRTPELRKVTKDMATVYEKGDRVFLRLAWDIPLVNITHSNKK